MPPLLRTVLTRFYPPGWVQITARRHFAGRNKTREATALIQNIQTTDISRSMDVSTLRFRLAHLRQLMKREEIDFLIIPSEDAHQSEYITPADARRAFISGFTGSAGTAVVSFNKAALATDGRYYNQASQQLSPDWILLKQGLPDVPTWQEWIVDEVGQDRIVGVDGTLIAHTEFKKLNELLRKTSNSKLLNMQLNIVDEIWGQTRPARPSNKVQVLGFEVTGMSFLDKITNLRKDLVKKKCAGIVVSMLDEIAWLLNLRGNDIPFNPVFFAYVILTAETTTLYIDEMHLSAEILDYLGSNVAIRPYEEVFVDVRDLGSLMRHQLSDLSSSFSEPTGTITKGTEKFRKIFISNNANMALAEGLGDDLIEEGRSPVEDAKAIKNEVELQGMRDCHIRDGLAVTKYLSWLESKVQGGDLIDEAAGAVKLEEIRSAGRRFMGLSFDTISSSGANAAIIHYKPELGGCSMIDIDKIYLCDSGAQYLDGTTDTTRTVHFGSPTDMEIKAYTLVLKGQIALFQTTFPKGTSGLALDTIARQFLWSEGLDYLHGTGHGVGSFLNVHEGPMGIGTRIRLADTPLAAGMVLSNEPGYYEDGLFGIRIENMMYVRTAETKHNFGNRPYFTFENLTMTPYYRKLVDIELLADSEIEWIDRFHEKVFEATHTMLADDVDALAWLVRETRPLKC